MFRSCQIIIRELCSLLKLYYGIHNSILICKRGVVAAYQVVWECVVEQWLGVRVYLFCHGFWNDLDKLLCWHSAQEFSQFLRIFCFTAENFSESERSSASLRSCVECPMIKRRATLWDGTGEESWNWRPLVIHLTSRQTWVETICSINTCTGVAYVSLCNH